MKSCPDELSARIGALRRVLRPLVIAVSVTLPGAAGGGLLALFKS